MKIHKLNPRGFSHHFVLMFIVVGVAIGGVGYLVKSHAQVPYNNVHSCPSQPMLSTASGSSSPSCTKYIQTVLGISADGSYGPITKAAVQKFQYDNKVTNSSCRTTYASCDGIVGPATWPKLVASNSAQTRAATPAAPAVPVASKAPAAPTAPKATEGTLACTSSLIHSDSLKLTYANAGANGVKLYRGSTIMASYPAASGNTIFSESGLIAGTTYAYTLRAGSVVLASASCATPKEPVTSPTPIATPPVSTPPVAPPVAAPPVTPPVSTTPVAAAQPKTNDECVKVFGATFRYDGTRCTSIVKPTCPAKYVLATAVSNANFNYYYCDPAPAPKPVVTNPLVTCTYFVGVNEIEKTDKTHNKTFCDTVNKNQVSWKSCTVIVNGKTVTAVHSVAYCAAHKPKASTPAPAKPTTASPAPAKPTTAVSYKASNCPSSKHTATIHIGDRGDCVAYLQSRLGVGQDGVYDKTGETRAKVDAKQRKACLETDGTVGPKTWAFINGGPDSCQTASKSGTSNSGSSSGAGPSTPGRPVLTSPQVGTLPSSLTSPIECTYVDGAAHLQIRKMTVSACDQKISAAGKQITCHYSDVTFSLFVVKYHTTYNTPMSLNYCYYNHKGSVR